MSGQSTTQQSGGAEDSNKQQLAMAAVTVGDGSCEGRQRQVNSSWYGGRQQLRRRASAGKGSCEDGRQPIPQRQAKATLTVGGGRFDGR